MDRIDNYIIDTLMRDLVGHDHKPTSFLVYLWLYAEQSRSNRTITISYQQIAESIGVSKSSAQSAVSWLLRRKLLAVTRESVTATPAYRVLTPWKRTPAWQDPAQRNS
jgi:DNA-binding MarR family transcriptional regulator